MNILICISDYKTGGIQSSFTSVLKWLISQSHSIDVLIVNEDYHDAQLESLMSGKFIRANNVNTFNKILPFSSNLKHYKLSSELKIEYDIIIDFEGYQIESALTAAKIKSKKKIIWVHSDYYNRYKYNRKFRIMWNLSNSKYEYYDEIVFVSKLAQENFKRLYGDYSLNDRVINNLINSENIFSKTEVKNFKFTPNIEHYNLCFLGRLVTTKNLISLLNIFSKTLENRNDIDLYFIGDGAERQKLERYVYKLGIQSHVFFLGNKTNPFPYLNKMDGTILVSNYEGQGISLYEAVALGLDIFISDNLKALNIPTAQVGNLVKNLSAARKGEKIRNNFQDYNNNIYSSLEDLIAIPNTKS